MGTEAFISSLVASLAWPVAAVALGLVFRAQLTAILGNLAERMKHLKSFHGPGYAFSFAEEQIMQARQDMQEIAAGQRTSPAPSGEPAAGPNAGPRRPEDAETLEMRERYNTLFRKLSAEAGRRRPPQTIYASVAYLEDAASEITARLGVTGPERLSVMRALDELQRQGALSESDADRARSASGRLARLNVVYGDSASSTTPTEAVVVLQLAWDLTGLLINASGRTGSGSSSSQAGRKDKTDALIGEKSSNKPEG